jgi:hypothetical protein
MTFVLTKEGARVLIDAADAPMVSRYTWHLDRDGYAVRSSNGTKAMHLDIVGRSSGLVVDHINGNRLDNRRANLRTTGHAGNSANRRPTGSSGFKGVTLHRTGKWQAQIKVGGKPEYLGLFDDPRAAASAYDAAALRAWGSFAWLNFPGAA